MGLALEDGGSQEAEVPVKRMLPVSRMRSRSAGKSAGKTKAWMAGSSPAALRRRVPPTSR